ncbi:MAG: flagellar export chaperone FlgN [Pseudothermotoga sp.]
MNDLISVLSKEETLLLQINDILKQQEQAVISKNLPQISAATAKLEEMLNAFENLEEERRDFFQRLKETLNLPQNMTFYEYAKSCDGVLLESLFKVTEQLNNTALRIERLKQLSDFQLHYIDVLVKLLNPQEPSTYNVKASLKKVTPHWFEIES